MAALRTYLSVTQGLQLNNNHISNERDFEPAIDF